MGDERGRVTPVTLRETYMTSARERSFSASSAELERGRDRKGRGFSA